MTADALRPCHQGRALPSSYERSVELTASDHGKAEAAIAAEPG